MPFLPGDPWALVALALVAAGVPVILFTKVPKAYALALLCLAVFFVQFLAESAGGDPVIEQLGLRSGDFLAGRAWWTPLTYMFVHAGFLHIFGNLVILLTAGPALEDKIGERRFLVIYFAAGFAAAAIQLLLGTQHLLGVGPGDVAIGASGAIFGVLTAFAVRYPRAKLPLFIIFIVIPGVPAMFILGLFLVLNVGLAYTGGQGVAWYAHFAGFLAGLAFALTLPRDLAAGGAKRAASALPDVEKLRPLATTPDLRELLTRIEQFDGKHEHDLEFVDAWLDRFFKKARCPGHADTVLERDGPSAAKCPRGDYAVDFARR
ncbi:MAG: rhomboid family intramembrane serine protease [Thermoplasmatota archaeon]